MQGKTAWILGFFSFLSGLNAINAVVMAINIGMEGTFQPYLIGGLTGDVPVNVYLFGSLVAMFLFLGGASSKMFSELSNKKLLKEISARTGNLEKGHEFQQELLESLKARVFLVDESLEVTKKMVANGFDDQKEDRRKSNISLANKVDGKLADAKDELTGKFGELGNTVFLVDQNVEGFRKEFVKGMNEQSEEIRRLRTQVTSNLASELTDFKNEMTMKLLDMEQTIQKSEERNRKNARAFAKQKDEIAGLKGKLEELEAELIEPKARLSSKSDVEEIRGIGKNIGNELREMEIAKVGDLVLADPKVIAEKTNISERMAEKFQGRAQLLMIPSVQEKDLALLEEVDITSRKKLANQDPIELSRKINEVANALVEKGEILEAEKPTIEEMHSWIKYARA